MNIKRDIVVAGIMVFLLTGLAWANKTVTIPIDQIDQKAAGPAALPPHGAAPTQVPTPAQIMASAQAAPAGFPQGPGLAPATGEDIRDITAPIPIPDPLFYLWYVAGGGLLIAIGLLIWKKMRSKASKRIESAHEKAFRLLTDTKPMMKPETAKAYSTAISHAMREYMETQFNMETLNLTTNEFLNRLKESPPPKVADHTERLEIFLNHCDLAKFAGFNLTMDQMQEMYANAWQFVDATIPEPVSTKGGKR